jgi:succinate-semialdehyde dehydrogenase / glutarate-semialdehyde dehydrogenase
MSTDRRYEPLALFANGEWRLSGGDGAAEVVSPIDGVVLAQLPLASDDELDATLKGAAEGLKVWRAMPPLKRSELLRRAAGLLRERADSVASTMSLELGKPWSDARGEVLKAADLIDWSAEEGRRAYGRTIPAPDGESYSTVLEPVGVVAAFTPWNFPAVSPARKIGSALAAGCACILKPSELAPGTAVAMTRAFADAGIPAGVVSLVHGDPSKVSRRLISSPVVRMVTFTGSVAVGKHIAELAAREMKPCVLELGGHGPVLVFEDIDLQLVAKASVAAKFRNSGQVCVSPTRFLVHSEIFERFASAFAAATASIRVGDPFESTTNMGPMSSGRRLNAIDELVVDAVSKGARLLLGGKRTGNSGFYYLPTVLADVPLTARIMQEEPFGPVAILQRFDHPDDALFEANRLPFGLASYVFTASASRGRSVSSKLESGIVGLNTFTTSSTETPFGGIKDSGYGREGGIDGVRAYLTTKTVIEKFAPGDGHMAS